MRAPPPGGRRDPITGGPRVKELWSCGLYGGVWYTAGHRRDARRSARGDSGMGTPGGFIKNYNRLAATGPGPEDGAVVYGTSREGTTGAGCGPGLTMALKYCKKLVKTDQSRLGPIYELGPVCDVASAAGRHRVMIFQDDGFPTGWCPARYR